MATVEIRTELIQLVVGMVGAAPGADNLTLLVDSVNAGASVLDIAVDLSTHREVTAIYPTFLTNEEFSTNYLTALIGAEVSAETLQEAIGIGTGLLNGGMSRGALMYEAITTLAGIDETNEAYGAAAARLNNRTEVAADYSVANVLSADTLEELQAVVASVDSTQASVDAALAAISSQAAEGQTFTLTATVDNITGSAGNDTITAFTHTLSALDALDGGGGTDTLIINGVDADGDPDDVNVALPSSVADIENIIINATASEFSDGSADVSGWTGVTNVTAAILADSDLNTLTVSDSADVTLTARLVDNTEDLVVNGGKNVTVNSAGGAAGSAVTVNGGAGITSANVTSTGDSIMINDNGPDTEAGTLTSVTVSRHTGTAMINSDALTDLTVANSVAGATVNAVPASATATRTLNISVNNVSGGTIADATATTVNVNAVTKDSIGGTLTAGAATSVGLNATGARLGLSDVNIGAAKTLTASGDSAITIAAATDVGALTSITASGTGGLTVRPTLATGVTVTGSEGDDAFSIAAHTKAVDLGAGDDTVTMTVNLGKDGSVAGGEGNDTVVVNSASNLSLARVSGFETLGLGEAAAGTYSPEGFTALTHGRIAGAVTYDEVDAGTDLTITADPGFGTTYVLDDDEATSDSLNLTITSTVAVNADTVTAAGIESVTINTDQVTARQPTGINHTLNLVDAQARSITVAGDAGLALTFAGTALTTFDASGTTTAAAAVSYTTGALTAAATLSGGAGGDTLDASGATKLVTLNGNGGNDMLTSGVLGSTINGGAGNDTLNGGVGVDVINGGAGNDTIDSDTGLDVLTGGDGDDTFIITVSTNGNSYAEISDFVLADDKLAMEDVNGTLTFNAAPVSLAGTAIFQNYLDEAADGNSGGSNSAISWFQFNGDTYVVSDNSNEEEFVNGTDSVVKLTGLIDLSTATADTFSG